MKVCILTTAFPRWQGDDRGSFILNAAKALANKGITVRVLAIHSPGAKTREIMDGIEVIRVRYLPEKLEVLQKGGGGLPAVWKKYPLARLALLPFVFTQIMAVCYYSRGFDLIHANWTLSGMVAWISRWVHHKPYIVTVHGSDLYQTQNLRLIQNLTRFALAGADRVVAVSQDLAGIVDRLGISKKKQCVIPDGIDVAYFHPGSENREKLILFVGSLIPRKGVNYLLNAFSKVSQVHPDAQLVIIGEGPLEAELEQSARSLIREGQVKFLGARPQEEVSDWMRRAKIFALPSLEEGLGVVLLEAIASGTPCVGSKIGGIPDVVVPEVGLLAPAGDSQALADSILQILDDPQKWLAMSRAARQRAQEVFDWQKIADRLIGVYKEAMIA